MPIPIKPIRNVDDVERLAESGMQRVGEVGQKTVENATKQGEDTSKAFIDQLYGVSEQSSEIGTEQPGSSQKSQTATPQQHNDSSQKSPEDQSQLEATRRKLEMLQGGNYNTQFSAEASLQRYRAKQREEDEKKQQEEQREEEEKEAERQRMQEVALPQGKHTGMPNVPKPKVALEREKTKTEVNRGSTG